MAWRRKGIRAIVRDLDVAADHRLLLDLLSDLEAELPDDASVRWSDYSIPQLRALAAGAGRVDLVAVLSRLEKHHSRAWRVDLAALPRDDQDLSEELLETWAAKGWRILAIDELPTAFIALVSHDGPLDANSALWGPEPEPEPIDPGIGYADRDLEELAGLLRRFEPADVPAFLRALYLVNRMGMSLEHHDDEQLLLLHLDVCMSSALSQATSRVTGRPSSGFVPARYELEIIEGARELADQDGARLLLGRCRFAGLQEFARHQDRPAALAQWLTFYQVLAVATGRREDPPPPAFLVDLGEGLSVVAVERGDDPEFEPR